MDSLRNIKEGRWYRRRRDPVWADHPLIVPDNSVKEWFKADFLWLYTPVKPWETLVWLPPRRESTALCQAQGIF